MCRGCVALRWYCPLVGGNTASLIWPLRLQFQNRVNVAGLTVIPEIPIVLRLLLIPEGIIEQHGDAVATPLQKLIVDVQMTVRRRCGVFPEFRSLHAHSQIGRQVALCVAFQPGQRQIRTVGIFERLDIVAAVRRPPETTVDAIAINDRPSRISER